MGKHSEQGKGCVERQGPGSPPVRVTGKEEGMKPIKAWAIGTFSGGKLLGIVRYQIEMKTREPCLYHTKADALRDVEIALPDDITARPVRVTIYVEE